MSSACMFIQTAWPVGHTEKLDEDGHLTVKVCFSCMYCTV